MEENKLVSNNLFKAIQEDLKQLAYFKDNSKNSKEMEDLRIKIDFLQELFTCENIEEVKILLELNPDIQELRN